MRRGKTHFNASADGCVLPTSTWPESCKRRETVWPNASWDPHKPTSTNARFHWLPCSTWRMAANTHRMHAQVSARPFTAKVAAFSVSVCMARLKRANACVSHGCSNHVSFAGTKWYYTPTSEQARVTAGVRCKRAQSMVKRTLRPAVAPAMARAKMRTCRARMSLEFQPFLVRKR